jgi:DNA-binding MarR family transcriptional regulator
MQSRRAAPEQVAAALRLSVGLLLRRLRQLRAEDDLSLPESAALARLDRGGPMTATALARLEQISPQSMGATLAALETRGLVVRRPHPDDRRCVVLSPTDAGLQTLRHIRGAQTQRLAQVLASSFSDAEIQQLLAAAPLLERLAQGL